MNTTEIQDFLDSLDKMRTIHKRKNEDYSSDEGLDNFDRSQVLVEWFKNPADKVFAAVIGIKLARLASLLNKEYENPNAVPNNESIDDTFIDSANYTLLWKARRNRDLRAKKRG